MADFLVTRENGGRLRIKALKHQSERPNDHALIQFDLYVNDVDQPVRLHDTIECPDHRRFGGGICDMCGGRGSSLNTPKVNIYGFTILDGNLTVGPTAGYLRGTVRLEANRELAFGQFAIDDNRRDGRSVIDCAGSWITVHLLPTGHLRIYPQGGGAHIASDVPIPFRLHFSRHDRNIFVDGLPFAHGSVNITAVDADQRLDANGNSRVNACILQNGFMRVEIIHNGHVISTNETNGTHMSCSFNLVL